MNTSEPIDEQARRLAGRVDDDTSVVEITAMERLTLACVCMGGQPGGWHSPPVELLTRLLGEKLADTVLNYSCSTERILVALPEDVADAMIMRARQTRAARGECPDCYGSGVHRDELCPTCKGRS